MFKKQPPKLIIRENYENGIYSFVEFSDCAKYRYSLTRQWNIEKPRMLVILFNPSAANEKYDDPTTIRCIKRSMLLGFGSIRICNLFSIISGNPKIVMSSSEPIGIYTDSIIQDACHWLKKCHLRPILICGWGNNGIYRNRAEKVKKILKQYVSEIYCLGLTKNSQPKHPLYIKYTEKIRKCL